MTTHTPETQDEIDKIAQARKDLEAFYDNCQTVILATVSSTNNPDASYAPTVVDEERRFYVYVSRLAKHTSNLKGSAPVSIMAIEDEQNAQSLFARRRLTLTCDVEEIARDTERFENMMHCFSEKFGGIMEGLKGMTDFSLFCLTPRNGRMVTGFGSAFRIMGTELDTHLRGRHGSGHQKEQSS